MVALADMHVHLAWFDDAVSVAAALATQGIAAYAVTVTPHEYESACRTFAQQPNVHVGAGAHPWWVADGRMGAEDVRHAVASAREARFVGEIGLDLSPAHTSAASKEMQVEALQLILAACDDGARTQGSKLLSLHAVRSAGTVLDLLAKTGCLKSCQCVFHWFSGTGDELHRAVQAGCWFSVNEMMLRTRRGREYARQIPACRLLTETDLPPRERSAYGAGEIIESLGRTLDTLREIRGQDMRDTIRANVGTLLA